MSTATTSTIDHGRQAVSSLGDKSTELENVKSKLEEYKRLADTDPLTHIWNRRAFDRHISRVYDSHKSVMFNALILADIDRFKEINDRHGHPVGDKIIQIVAGILQSSSRGDMFVARTGGEEFALIVEGGSVESTVAFADRLRTIIAETPFTNTQTRVSYGPITISMGVCMASDAGGSGGPVRQGRPGALPLQGQRPQPGDAAQRELCESAAARTGCSTSATEAPICRRNLTAPIFPEIRRSCANRMTSQSTQ